MVSLLTHPRDDRIELPLTEILLDSRPPEVGSKLYASSTTSHLYYRALVMLSAVNGAGPALSLILHKYRRWRVKILVRNAQAHRVRCSGGHPFRHRVARDRPRAVRLAQNVSQRLRRRPPQAQVSRIEEARRG